MKKYLIVTGGSRGIGRATILRFRQAGWHLINMSRSNSDIAGVKNINVDLADVFSIEKSADQLAITCQDAEEICLVHNAAYLKKDSVGAISLNTLNETLQINVIAPVRLNNICLPLMKSGSSIIYIGSALAEMAVSGCASYIISKHAMVGLMRATCQDLAERNIRTVCICPGFVNTQLLKETMDANTIDWLVKHKVIAKRLIAPEEIAELIFTYAHQPLINGEVIHADLGQMTT